MPEQPQLSEEQKKMIIKALQERGANLPCPRCGNNGFTLLDGYFNSPLSKELSTLILGGPTVPSVIVACTRCGYLSQHALGALGLLPSEKKEGKENE